MISRGKLIIGSRGSQLALWQSEWVKNELINKFPNLEITIDIIKTAGDKNLESPLSKIGERGLFTKELEHALIEERIDLAVHSLKDLPTVLPEGLVIGAITKREDVRDVFISHPSLKYKQLEDVPKGGTIATGSLRRRSQLLNWRPDLKIADLRGNLNTRLAKLDSSTAWDGIILARAGVLRFGYSERIAEILPVRRILPAPGQGSLAIEIRACDKALLRYLKPLENTAATIAASGERSFLKFLEGGCQVPVGTYGRIEKNEFRMDGMIGSLDGKKILRGSIHGDPDRAEELGRELARTLHDSGGGEILADIREACSASII